MDPISPITNSTGAASQTAAVASGSASALSSDFETFLKMLTVQMRNQDPLNPVESADFAVQLATFSSVEQQVRTNDILGGLGDRLGALGVGQLLGWVGMTARAEMPVIWEGEPVPIAVTTSAGATEARLVVRDRSGTIVQSTATPTGGGDILFTGTGDDGQTLPPGRYDVSVESFAGEALLGTSAVVQTGRIVEARNDPAGTTLVMEGGQEIAASQVLGLRESP